MCLKISDLSTDGTADIFYEDFRNGLVHNARIKNGSEFSVDINTLAIRDRGRLIVHPELLARAVGQLLEQYVESLYQNPKAQRTFRNKLKRQFRFELHN